MQELGIYPKISTKYLQSIQLIDNLKCKRMFKVSFPYKYDVDCITAVSI